MKLWGCLFGHKWMIVKEIPRHIIESNEFGVKADYWVTTYHLRCDNCGEMTHKQMKGVKS